jgi:signal transduction histidine kinase
MHRLLARQLKKCGRDPLFDTNDEFLLLVNAAYQKADEERMLLERSLELTSKEMLRDLEEMKRVKEALSESQSFLEKAQMVAKIGSWLGTSESMELSPEVYRIFGIEAGSFDENTESFYQFVHPSDVETAKEARGRLWLEGLSYGIDYRIRRSGTDLRWIHERATLIRDDAGLPQKMIGIVQDITEQRELESKLRQSQKMEAVGRLAGGIAHDFNNILTAIKGYSSFLKMSLKKSHDLFSDVAEIEKSADRAAALTHQLLAFSRKQILKPEVLDLNSVITGIGNMMRRLINEDIELVIRLKPGLGLVRADPGQVEQVIMNLIVNGRDAMPSGGKLIIETDDVAMDVSPLGVASVKISVADGGVGMNSEVMTHIFEPFFTTKEQGKGTGLGLSTVYGIISQSQGHIGVESVPGQGTKFSIYLPRLMDDAAPKAALDPQHSGSLRGHETVCIVEDDPVLRMVISRTLKEQGYNILVAPDGKEALSLFKENPVSIDIVVTDIIMPGMNGRTLVEHLMSLEPKLRVLYMSGYTDDVIAQHGVLEPETPFLQKPFTPRMLAEKMREILCVNAP